MQRVPADTLNALTAFTPPVLLALGARLFAGLVGASAAGDWRLKVKDKTPRDSGTIVKWGLAIGYQ